MRSLLNIKITADSTFYPGARHELLVETNKLEVFADIPLGWTNSWQNSKNKQRAAAQNVQQPLYFYSTFRL